MENEVSKQFKQILDDFLSEFQIKMDDFLDKLNFSERIPNQKPQKAVQSSELGFMDFSKLKITKEGFIKKFKEVLQRSQHKVMIIAPTIMDIDELEVYNVRSGINLNIACFIDIEVEKNQDLLEELESFDNFEIRNYEDKDRWVILRDGEELLCAAIGSKADNYLVFHTSDPAHFKLFSNLATDAWLKSRKI